MNPVVSQQIQAQVDGAAAVTTAALDGGLPVTTPSAPDPESPTTWCQGVSPSSKPGFAVALTFTAPAATQTVWLAPEGALPSTVTVHQFR